MHVLVFEPRYKGHFLVYVRLIIAALLEIGCDVTLGTGQDVLDKVEYATHLKPLESRFKIKTAATDEPGLPRGMAGQFREILRNTRPDHVLVPTADGLVQECGVRHATGRSNGFSGVEAEAMILRCSFAFPQSRLRQRLRYAAIRRFIRHSGFSRLYAIDAFALESLAQVDPALAKRMSLMPDPVDDVTVSSKIDARRQLGIPEDARYIGTTGILDERKGVDRLIRAFARTRLPDNHRLLIGGMAAPESRPVIQAAISPLLNSGRAIWIERYLSNQEMALLISSLDLMCTPYVDHVGPSAILAKAACIGRPTLATNYGWCGSIIPRFGLGWTCNTADETTFAQAISTHLPAAQDLTRTPLLERWFAYLSPLNFVNSWTSRIRERIGLPPAPVLRWDWVQNGN